MKERYQLTPKPRSKPKENEADEDENDVFIS